MTGERISLESPLPGEFLSIKDKDEKYKSRACSYGLASGGAPAGTMGQ